MNIPTLKTKRDYHGAILASSIHAATVMCVFVCACLFRAAGHTLSTDAIAGERSNMDYNEF